MLADMESLEKRLSKKNKIKSENDDLDDLLGKAFEKLKKGEALNDLIKNYDSKTIKMSNLLSIKPKIIVCNTDEESVAKGNEYTNNVKKKFSNDQVVLISAEIEQQINELNNEEAKDFMKEIGLDETGLDRLIKSSYKSLDLCTYFTAGPQETRAWTVKNNSKAPDAAEVIHTDFKKGFIKAEVISYDDYIKFKGEAGSRDNGKLRIEGKDYLVKDGDVLHFRFNT